MLDLTSVLAIAETLKIECVLWKDLKMIEVMLNHTHPPELSDETAVCFEVSFSRIHSVILERIAAHFDVGIPGAVKMLLDAGMQDCLGGVAI